jgi:protein-L-isoaspartate(D-aspartate) O-methyltransferase
MYDEQRRQLPSPSIGPFTGSSGWHEVKQTFAVPKESREGILLIGLFGATGVACFDKLELNRVE